MSEAVDTTTTKGRGHRGRPKRKFSRGRLPTPPPDPIASEEAIDKPGSPTDNYSIRDAQFLEYINSLQKSPPLSSSRSDSLFTPIAVTEDAFDHLDKLYKLMEQMLNLRQQNARLQKRVKDLEHLKNLQSMHRHLDNSVVFEDIPEMDDDSSFAESLLDTMLTGTKKEVKPKPWTRSRLRQSLMRRQRNRSSSVNERSEYDDIQNQRRTSGCNDREKSSKVSKWTKVKAAFRWEKASPSVSGAKSQDSGIGGIQPVNCEVARYLRVPSTTEDVGISPNDSGAADGSTPGSLSSASSADDIYRQEHKSDLQISDDDRHSINLEDSHIARGSHHGNSKKLSRVKIRNAIIPNSDTSYEKHSAQCDEIKNDTSDNDDVESKYRDFISKENIHGKKFRQDDRNRERGDIPADVISRYRQAIAEDELNRTPKRTSKWTRVKKAFLTPTIHTGSNSKSRDHHSSGPLISGHSRESQLDKTDNESRKIQDEIQKNYRQLQKKLSLEFHDKLREWEKCKITNVNTTAGSHGRSDGSTDEQRDQAFLKKMEEWQRIKSQPPRVGPNVQMIREDNLAPEFKKKLEEWHKIKKYAVKDDSVPVTKIKKKLGEWPKWKSVSGHREEPHHNEHQPLSDEFLKKLEEWRKIKDSHRSYETKERSPSPKSVRKHNAQPSPTGQSKKEKDDSKELHWFEKELDKIEREKQRLEHERQKYLQREERLTKIRRAVMGNENKKDILIHTPSGFYKFEGISRKFTQKLCEWEKAQGIGPEASTFALLTSHFTPHITVDFYDTRAPTPQYAGPKLVRSKSAESITMSNSMQPIPSSSHHPSSLSLNDVDELEKQCLELSRESLIQDLEGSFEKLQNAEPEAVIVEVEDVVEETASALEERLEEKHFPVYQRQMALDKCEERSLVVPCVQRMETKTAQYTYFLIGEIIKIIKAIGESENSLQKLKAQNTGWDRSDLEESQLESESESASPDLIKLQDKNETQRQRSDIVLEKIIRLQEIHSRNISDITVEGCTRTNSQFSTLLEAAQDSFAELLQMAEQLQNFLHSRCAESFYKISFQFADSSYSDVTAITSELLCKLSELKRILTYIYAASDKTAPGRKLKGIKKNKKETKNIAGSELESSGEYQNINNNESLGENQNDQNKLIAKRMRYKKKSKTLYESEDSDVGEHKINSNSKPQDGVNKENMEIVTIDPVIVQKLVIPTKSNIVDGTRQPSLPPEKKPIEVFVKTTRKLFTPVVESQGVILPKSPSCSIIDIVDQYPCEFVDSKDTKEETEQTPTVQLPPPLASPNSQRKINKEISPSIRLMLVKYNQMISGQEGFGTTRSACSSGSASPVAWRSPVSERRVLVQRERYLEEIKRSNSRCNEVKKSASVSVLNSEKKTTTAQAHKISIFTPENNHKILRSTSTSVIQTNIDKHSDNIQDRNHQLKLLIPKAHTEEDKHSSEVRYNKIQKAKEEFLNSVPTPLAGPSSAPVFPSDHNNIAKYPTRSRFSQISMGSESSYDSSAYEGMLVKSASAGMINVDEDTYKKIDPAFHCDGYLSLPRSVQKQKEGFLSGKLALSNIAAKFRKVRMRRNKDQKKMNTVSALCRQSLVVDINPDGNQEVFTKEKENRRDSLTVPLDNRASSSEDTSPSSSRSGSWIRRSRIFKNL